MRKKREKTSVLKQHWPLGVFTLIVLGAALGAYRWAVLRPSLQETVEIRSATATGGSESGNTLATGGTTCIFERADFTHDGRVTDADIPAYQEVRANHSAEADINADGRNGDLLDDQCMQSFLNANTLATPPEISFPTAQSTLRGITRFSVRTPLFMSLSDVDLMFRLASGTTYSRRYHVSDVRSASDSTTININFDSLAVPNGPIDIWFCPVAGSTAPCGLPIGFTVANQMTIVSPTAGSTVTNTSVPLRISVSGDVRKIETILFRSNGTEAVMTRSMEVKDTAGLYTANFDLSNLTNGTYKIKSNYVPFLWEYYGPRPEPRVVEFNFVKSSETPIPPNSTINTNSSVNTNTAVGEDDGSSVPQPQPSPAAVTLTQPKAGAQVYDLGRVTGTVSGGDEVVLVLKTKVVEPTGIREQSLAQFRQVVSGPGRDFEVTLTNPLAPGAYTLLAAPVVAGRIGEYVQTTFQVLRPAITIRVPEPRPVRGRLQLGIAVKGMVSGLDVYQRRGALTEILLGHAQRVSGAVDDWALVIDSTSLLNGTAEYFARARSLDGSYVVSNTIKFEIHNPNVVETPVIPTEAPSPTVPPASSSNSNANVNTNQAPAANTNSSSPGTGNVNGQANFNVNAGPSNTNRAVVPTVSQLPDDPRLAVAPTSDELLVKEVANQSGETPQTTPTLTLSGVGPASSVVTIFIYSNPIVVTTRTDASGNWSYTLDRSLSDGQHEVYVTVTDQTGTVKARSNSFRFFVAEARAVSEEDFVRSTSVPARPSDSYLTWYAALAGLVVGLTVVIYLIVRLNRRTQKFARA